MPKFNGCCWWHIENLSRSHHSSYKLHKSLSWKFHQVSFIKFFYRMSFSLTSNDSSYEWSCSNASLDIDGRFEGEPIKDTFWYNNCGESLTAPAKYSYSCFNVTLKNDNSSITFKQFQVRIFFCFSTLLNNPMKAVEQHLSKHLLHFGKIEFYGVLPEIIL